MHPHIFIISIIILLVLTNRFNNRIQLIQLIWSTFIISNHYETCLFGGWNARGWAGEADLDSPLTQCRLPSRSHSEYRQPTYLKFADKANQWWANVPPPSGKECWGARTWGFLFAEMEGGQRTECAPQDGLGGEWTNLDCGYQSYCQSPQCSGFSTMWCKREVKWRMIIEWWLFLLYNK